MAEQDLSHVDAIIANLAPIAGKQRGGPLKADEWNVLVDAVHRLAVLARGRALAGADALAAGYAPAEHEHLGAIGLAWLDGQTRDLIEGGGGGDFAVRDDLQRLDKGVTKLRGDVDGLRGELTSLRELLLRLRDEVIGSQRDYGKLRLRVEAFKDIEVGFERLDREFGKLGPRLDQVLVLREQIGDGEGQVDLGAFGERIGALEQLREQLIGNAPAPDLRAIQQDLTRLSDKLAGLGTGGNTPAIEEGRIREIVEVELGPTTKRLDALDGRTTEAETRLGKLATYDEGLSRISTLEGKFGAVDTKLGALDGRATSFEGKLATFDGKLAAVDGAIAQKVAGLGAELGGRIGALEGGFKTLDAGVKTIDGKLGALGDLDSRFAARATVEQLGGSLAALKETAAQKSQLDALAAGVAEAGAGLDDLGARVTALAGVTTSLGDWRSGVETRLVDLAKLGGSEGSAMLLQRITDLEGALGGVSSWRTGVDGRFDALEIKTAGIDEGRVTLANQLAEVGATLADQGALLGGVTSDVAKLSGWRGAVDGSLETLGSRASQLESWRGTATSSLASLGESVAGVADFGARIGALESGTKALTTWRSGVDGTLGTLGARTSELEGWKGTATGTLASLGESVAGVADFGARIGALESGTKALTTWRGTVDGTLGTLAARAAELESWKGTATGTLASLGESAAASANHKARIEALESGTNSLAARATDVDKQLGTLSTKVAEQAGYGGRLGALEGLQLGGRVGALETATGTLKAAQTELKTALDTQAATLADTRSTLTTLSKDLTAAQSGLKTLSTQMSTATSTLEQFSAWRTTVDTKLGSMEGRQVSVTEWQKTIDQRLVVVDQSLGSLANVNTRLGALETTSRSLTTWQKATDTQLGDLQLRTAKAVELGTRIDKLDTQLAGLTQQPRIPIRRPG